MLDTAKPFKSADDALVYAFNYSDQQYAISAMAKLMKGGLIGGGKGLVALDGAGQAGYILRHVMALDEIERSILIARYASRVAPCTCHHACCSGESMSEHYKNALLILDHRVALPAITGMSHRVLRQHILRFYFEGSDKRRKIDSVGKAAERLKVPKRTAYDLKTKIDNALREKDKDARTGIHNALSDMCGEATA